MAVIRKGEYTAITFCQAYSHLRKRKDVSYFFILIPYCISSKRTFYVATLVGGRLIP